MSLAMIDAREWQNCFDLETGARLDGTGEACAMVGSVLSRHPYPGDMDEAANQWVTDTALDLIGAYAPGLVCLSYVQQFFSLRHFAYSHRDREQMTAAAMREANRFVRLSGYTPVIVGTGPMTPLKGLLDLSDLDGLAISSNWSARYCGIHYPSTRDLGRIRSIPEIDVTVTRQEWADLFTSREPGLDMPEDWNLMPDYLLAAKEGFGFKALGTTLRQPVMVPSHSFEIPVSTPLGRVSDLREIKSLILSGLAAGPGNAPARPIALIMVEGAGFEHFPADACRVANGTGWFCYEPGDAFYLTLTTGKHQPFAYPLGYRYFDQAVYDRKFPFSGYLTALPQNTLALAYPGRSIAVGNRSMYMHMVFGADISIECFARNLFNQGCMAVIHNDTKSADTKPGDSGPAGRNQNVPKQVEAR